MSGKKVSCVSIHKLCTVPLWYKELLALLVYLTWLLHRSLGLRPVSFLVLLHRFTSIEIPLLVAVTGELLGVLLDRVGPLHFHPCVCYITLHTHMCRGVLAFINYIPYLFGTGSFWLYWFILHHGRSQSTV